MSEEKNELMLKEQTDLAMSMYEGDSIQHTGLEDIRKEDMAYPFLKIAQKQTPQANKNEQGYIEGLQEGQFFNNMTRRVYGESINLIVVAYYVAFLEWEGDGVSAVFKGQCSELEFEQKKSKLRQEGSKYLSDKGTYWQETRNFFVCAADYPEDGMMLFVLKPAAFSHTKKWVSLMKMQTTKTGKPLPIWSTIWNLRTVYDKNDKGSWYNIGTKGNTPINRVGLIVDPNVIERLNAECTSLSSIDKNTINIAADAKESEIVTEDTDY